MQRYDIGTQHPSEGPEHIRPWRVPQSQRGAGELMAAFVVAADAKAGQWLAAHPSTTPRVIAYVVHRCCGGGRICDITIRTLRSADALDRFTSGTAPDGSRFLIDRRAARRLPKHLTLTVRGPGPLKHLDLVLSGEQWGDLLYT